MIDVNSLSPSGVFRNLVLAALLFLSSCSAARMEQVVTLPATPPLSRSIGYAVIVSSYVQVRDTPSSEGVSLGYYRRGAVLPIVERRSVRQNDAARVWLLNAGDEKGWIPESDVSLFDNEAKARTAAEGFSK